MAQMRIERLLAEFRNWCAQKRGRQSEAAVLLGVQPQVVSNWFAGSQRPTGEQALAIIELLARERARQNEIISRDMIAGDEYAKTQSK